jgi:polysaccharide pyruvyl transferase WcaK-like protein
MFGLLGSGNIGNNVSMESIVAYLGTDHPEAIVDAMCSGPETVTRRYGIPARPMCWYQRYETRTPRLPTSVLKLLGKVFDVFLTASWVRRHDVVIVPGMGTMEATLPLLAWRLPYSLILLSGWSRIFGTKVAFVSIGAGPVKERLTRQLLDASARLAFYRSYRDNPSRDIMRKRGVDTSRDHVYADLAFGIPSLSSDPGDPRIVAVGVMEYHGNNDDSGQAAEIRASYVATIKTFVRWLIDNDHDVRILIADENQSEKDVGEEILADVRAYRPDLDPGRLIAEYPTSFAELMRVMAPASTVVATRFHSVICALRLGKPVVSLGYAQKFNTLLAGMGLGAFYQSAKFPDADLLIAQFTDLEKRNEELRQLVAAGNAANEQSVAAQFTELSAVLFSRGA